MQQIADWLEKLGMPEYTQRFAEKRHRENEPCLTKYLLLLAPHAARKRD